MCACASRSAIVAGADALLRTQASTLSRFLGVFLGGGLATAWIMARCGWAHQMTLREVRATASDDDCAAAPHTAAPQVAVQLGLDRPKVSRTCMAMIAMQIIGASRPTGRPRHALGQRET
jgi:hypothetical protein